MTTTGSATEIWLIGNPKSDLTPAVSYWCLNQRQDPTFSLMQPLEKLTQTTVISAECFIQRNL